MALLRKPVDDILDVCQLFPSGAKWRGIIHVEQLCLLVLCSWQDWCSPPGFILGPLNVSWPSPDCGAAVAHKSRRMIRHIEPLCRTEHIYIVHHFCRHLTDR